MLRMAVSMVSSAVTDVALVVMCVMNFAMNSLPESLHFWRHVSAKRSPTMSSRKKLRRSS